MPKKPKAVETTTAEQPPEAMQSQEPGMENTTPQTEPPTAPAEPDMSGVANEASLDGNEPEQPGENSLDDDLSEPFEQALPSDPRPNSRQAFYGLDFHSLDKHLSPEEQREWNAIYASYRAGSILTGKVVGVDVVRVGELSVSCLVVLDYRVKVLIPHTEVWADEESERSTKVLRRFFGAEVDYIVTEVDREGDCVVATRKLAQQYRRRSFRKRLPNPGDLVDCRILAVTPSRMLLECGGYETTLTQQNISYGTILDTREDYRPGQTVKAVFKGLDGNRITVSIKEVNPHPFDNAEMRHPLQSRRMSRIMGKYAGGVFCELEKGFTCMCLYTKEQQDSDFDLGDNVIIVVTKYDYKRKLVYGRILTGW